MSFRDRRRRLLGDDSLDTEASEDRDPFDRASAPAPGIGQQPRAYAAAAQSALNRPIRDFFPSRLAMMALVAVGGLVLVSVVELAHAWAGRLADVLGADEARVFDLGVHRQRQRLVRGNAVGNLGPGGDVHLRPAPSSGRRLSRSLPRLDLDGNRVPRRQPGRNHQPERSVRGLCSRAAAWSGVADTIVWPAVLAALLGLAGIRLLLEVRRCRGALALLLLAGLGFSAAAAIDHGWFVDTASIQRQPIERGILLAGYVLMLTTLLFYARYVTLEIDGLVAVVPARQKPRKVKRAAAPVADEIRVDTPKKSAPQVRTDLDSVARPSPSAPTTPVRPVASNNTPSNGSGGQDHRPLSRAERKRLRREARMQA